MSRCLLLLAVLLFPLALLPAPARAHCGCHDACGCGQDGCGYAGYFAWDADADCSAIPGVRYDDFYYVSPYYPVAYPGTVVYRYSSYSDPYYLKLDSYFPSPWDNAPMHSSYGNAAAVPPPMAAASTPGA